jgi:hypothetical protein
VLAFVRVIFIFVYHHYIYHLHHMQFYDKAQGEWQHVVIDDRIPCRRVAVVVQGGDNDDGDIGDQHGKSKRRGRTRRHKSQQRNNRTNDRRDSSTSGRGLGLGRYEFRPIFTDTTTTTTTPAVRHRSSADSAADAVDAAAGAESGSVLWPMLIEKALAKFYGCYAALRCGGVHRALELLTGGVGTGTF